MKNKTAPSKDLKYREIQPDEIPQVANVAVSFWSESNFDMSIDRDQVGDMVKNLIQGNQYAKGLFHVNPDPDNFIDVVNLVGFLGGVLHRHWVDGGLVAGELAWYIKPEHRGRWGLKMYRDFEEWARVRNADRITMLHRTDCMPGKVRRFYEREGFRHIESHYSKRVE